MAVSSMFFFASLVLIFMVATTRAEFGPCRYDPDACSCKLNSGSTGVCWDRVSGTPSAGSCTSRSCSPGWACACQGRTHVCSIRSTPIIVLDSQTGQDTGDCHEEVAPRAKTWQLELGEWDLGLSRKGLLANACNQVSVWHNGYLLGSYGNDPVVTLSNLDEEYDGRTVHKALELKPGDVLAFRFKNASYLCYNSKSELRVNGTTLDTESTGVESYFSKGFTEGWNLPGFTPTFSPQESGASYKDFFPLRESLSTGTAVTPGDDLWEADDGSLDHHTSNFYFIIKLSL